MKCIQSLVAHYKNDNPSNYHSTNNEKSWNIIEKTLSLIKLEIKNMPQKFH